MSVIVMATYHLYPRRCLQLHRPRSHRYRASRKSEPICMTITLTSYGQYIGLISARYRYFAVVFGWYRYSTWYSHGVGMVFS